MRENTDLEIFVSSLGAVLMGMNFLLEQIATFNCSPLDGQRIRLRVERIILLTLLQSERSEFHITLLHPERPKLELWPFLVQ